MQFSVCEEMYFESNNTITVGAIRVKFSAIFLFFLSLSLLFPFLPGFVGLVFRHDHARRVYVYNSGEHAAC